MIHGREAPQGGKALVNGPGFPWPPQFRLTIFSSSARAPDRCAIPREEPHIATRRSIQTDLGKKWTKANWRIRSPAPFRRSRRDPWRGGLPPLRRIGLG